MKTLKGEFYNVRSGSESAGSATQLDTGCWNKIADFNIQQDCFPPRSGSDSYWSFVKNCCKAYTNNLSVQLCSLKNVFGAE